MTADVVSLIEPYADTFGMIAFVINSFGNFHIGEIDYTVTRQIPQTDFHLNPHTGTIENLCQVVVALEEHSEKSYRFLKLNPIMLMVLFRMRMTSCPRITGLKKCSLI